MEPDPELFEQARRLFAGRVEFLLSAPSLDHLPGPISPRSPSPAARTSARAR
jgi:GTP-binding protein